MRRFFLSFPAQCSPTPYLQTRALPRLLCKLVPASRAPRINSKWVLFAPIKITLCESKHNLAVAFGPLTRLQCCRRCHSAHATPRPLCGDVPAPAPCGAAPSSAPNASTSFYHQSGKRAFQQPDEQQGLAFSHSGTMSDVGRGRRGRISWVIPQILMRVQMPPGLLRATPVSTVQGETMSLCRINSCRKRAHKLLIQTKP